MECVLKILDELDDLCGCVALRWESLRRSLLNLLILTLIVEAVVLDDPTWLFTVIVTYGLIVAVSLIARTPLSVARIARGLRQDLRV